MHESLVDELVVRLVDRLLSQDWPPGVRIPTERRLSDEFQMSRATVRSAIDRLAGWNMLVSRQGSGTLALPRGKWRVGVFPYMMASLYRAENWGELVPLIFDALGMRRGMVLDFLERAAANTKGKDMTVSREACHEAWEGRNSRAFLAADDRYHLSILDIAGLTATTMLINEIEQTYESAVTIFAGDFKLPEMYRDTHLGIVDALEAGDGETARSLKSAYYEKMDEAIIGGLPEGIVNKIRRLADEK
jgi:GntR family transcriptional repressor for pyruvate dehydrogenase complex